MTMMMITIIIIMMIVMMIVIKVLLVFMLDLARWKISKKFGQIFFSLKMIYIESHSMQDIVKLNLWLVDVET